MRETFQKTHLKAVKDVRIIFYTKNNRNGLKMSQLLHLVILACCLLALGGIDAVPRQDCICTQEYAPVCGADGRTYSNDCGRMCAGVPLAHIGVCGRDCFCPQVYLPVCGVDGRTYGNDCIRSCSGVPLDYIGACGPPCPPNRPRANCTRDPCTVTLCTCFPMARCVFDNCGGCFARFFIGKMEVTKMCKSIIFG